MVLNLLTSSRVWNLSVRPIPSVSMNCERSLHPRIDERKQSPGIPAQSAPSRTKSRDQLVNNSPQIVSNIRMSGIAEDPTGIQVARTSVHGGKFLCPAARLRARRPARNTSRRTKLPWRAQPSRSVENASDPVRTRLIADFLKGRQRIPTRLKHLRAAWMERTARRGGLRVRNIA